MPKGTKNRRDDARENDLGGGFGRDADYEWIRYLGEGRSSSGVASSGASSSQASSQPPAPAVAAARPALLPQRVELGGVQPDAPPHDSLPPMGHRRERRRSHARPVEHPSWPEQQIGYVDQQRLAADPPPPSDGGTGRTRRRGRADKARQGRATDELFNPDAEEYSQPLYPHTDGPRPMPEQERRRTGRHGQRGLTTAEYAQPLYPLYDADPATDTRLRRPDPGDDPSADTDPRTRLVPAQRQLASPPARRHRSPSRSRGTAALPKRTTSTAPQRRLTDLDLADRATGAGVGLARGAEQPSGPTAVYVIADLGTDSGASGTSDLQSAATLAPSRPAVRPDRKRQGQDRPRQTASQRRARRRMPVMAWILIGVLVVVAVSAAGYKFFLPKTSHIVSAPARAGGYVRQQGDATADTLRQRIVKAAAGSVSNVVDAVYQRSSGPGTDNGPQVVVLIGGNLAGGSSASSLISAYMARLSGAVTTRPGGLGGQAACAPGSNGGPAECAWADNDTFGVVVSATMNSGSLAAQMRQMRPLVEHAVR